jgi:hypothetical protein
MSGIVNVRDLAVGTRVVLESGTEAEIVANPGDGVWVFVRGVASDGTTGEEEMIFAQDVVEVRSKPLSGLTP